LQSVAQQLVIADQMKEPIDSSAKSLQLKPAKGDHFEILPRTPSRTEDSIGSSTKAPSLPWLTTLPNVSDVADESPFEIPSLPLLTTLPSVSEVADDSICEACEQGLGAEQDPLQQAIAQARATKHLVSLRCVFSKLLCQH